MLAGLAALAAVGGAGCGQGGPARTDSPAPGGAVVVERGEHDPDKLAIEDLITRRVPGVLVRRSGGGITVQIRGQGKLGGRTDALVVIDGVPQESANLLLELNPAEVERIEVLMDTAAARFGVRGANGVLLITTRRR